MAHMDVPVGIGLIQKINNKFWPRRFVNKTLW
jgi:hypothetical protein